MRRTRASRASCRRFPRRGRGVEKSSLAAGHSRGRSPPLVPARDLPALPVAKTCLRRSRSTTAETQLAREEKRRRSPRMPECRRFRCLGVPHRPRFRRQRLRCPNARRRRCGSVSSRAPSTGPCCFVPVLVVFGFAYARLVDQGAAGASRPGDRAAGTGAALAQPARTRPHGRDRVRLDLRRAAGKFALAGHRRQAMHGPRRHRRIGPTGSASCAPRAGMPRNISRRCRCFLVSWPRSSTRSGWPGTIAWPARAWWSDRTRNAYGHDHRPEGKHSARPLHPRRGRRNNSTRGEITLDSLAFVEGLTQWTPLREVLARVDAAAPPPQPPPAPVATMPIGTGYATAGPVNPVGAMPIGTGYSYAATMQPPSHLVYAGFWLRFVAIFIDGVDPLAAASHLSRRRYRRGLGQRSERQDGPWRRSLCRLARHGRRQLALLRHAGIEPRAGHPREAR